MHVKIVLWWCLVCAVSALESGGGPNGALRDARKLFGGYRITPRFCKPTKTPEEKGGPNICMFNHECSQRNGEVVGACMDGFLFGTCCHLPGEYAGELVESESHTVKNVDNSLATAYHHSTHKPAVSTVSVISNGVSQDSLTILPTADGSDVVQISGSQPHFTTTGVTHHPPDTIVLDEENEINSSDFKASTKAPAIVEDRKTTMRSEDTTLPYSPDTPIIQISISNGPSTYGPYGPYPTYQKPVFRPKPSSSPVSDANYVRVPTITHSTKQPDNTEQTSVVNIVQFYNDTSSSPYYTYYTTTSNKPPSTSYSYSNSPTKKKATTSKPPSTSYVFSTTLPPRPRPDKTTTTKTKRPSNTRKPTTVKRPTTQKPPSTSYVYSTTLPPRRTTSKKPTRRPQTKPTRRPTKPTNTKKTTTPYIYPPSTLRPAGHSTYGATPGAFHPTKKPSSTYVYNSLPTRRPPTTVDTHVAGPGFSVTGTPNSQLPFSPYPSPAPTVIVLGPVAGEGDLSRPVQYPANQQPPNTYQSSRPAATAPQRKPINQITVNNHVTQNIYSTSARPSPTILITPKPSISSSYQPPDDYSQAEIIQSADDLNSFPPVRNPNLNMSVPVLTEDDVTTPAFIEDQALEDNVEQFVNKIIQGLQEPFEGLRDVVVKGNTTKAGSTTTKKPTKKQGSTTKRPARPNSSPRPATTTRTTTRRTTTRRTTTRRQRPPATTKKPATTTRRTTTAKRTKATRRPTTTTQSFIESENDEPSYRNQCGVRPLIRSGRIVGGKGAEFGEFPWQVLVRESTWLGLFTKNKCGGVLIGSKYVMTAAHCQPGFLASLVAVFGEFDISGEREGKRSISRNVKRVIVHRQYDPATFANDLALLELESPVQFDEHIVPICLPREGEDFIGRMAIVTGWGRLKYNGGVPSVLQEVQVPIMENHVCQEMFRTAGHSKVILESFLCAGYANGQKDACEGDSGGPLVLQRPDGRYQLAGTVSHGIKCAAPYLPGVYMRTTYYKPWITSITGLQ